MIFILFNKILEFWCYTNISAFPQHWLLSNETTGKHNHKTFFFFWYREDNPSHHAYTHAKMTQENCQSSGIAKKVFWSIHHWLLLQIYTNPVKMMFMYKLGAIHVPHSTVQNALISVNRWSVIYNHSNWHFQSTEVGLLCTCLVRGFRLVDNTFCFYYIHYIQLNQLYLNSFRRSHITMELKINIRITWTHSTSNRQLCKNVCFCNPYSSTSSQKLI